MARVRIVLHHPETAANVGAAARAIANTGLSGLDLVAPGDWRTVESWRMAWRAEDILEQARVFDRLPDALAGAVYVAGLAGRPAAKFEPLTVREMAEEVAALDDEAPAAIVLGCESKGLSEQELCFCQRRVRIPSHPRQPSLNLGQAVMIACYEIFVAGSAAEGSRERASHAQTERALALFREALLAIDFLPEQNPEARFVEWRELFGRAGLSPREVRILLAFARRVKNTARLAREARRHENEAE